MPKRKFTLLFMGWMLLITVLSLFSFSLGGEGKRWFPHTDKVVHFTFHFFIVILGFLFLTETRVHHWPWQKKLLLLLLFSILYGALIEYLQWLMPFGRSAEIWDMLANISGAVMGGLLIQKLRLRIPWTK